MDGNDHDLAVTPGRRSGQLQWCGDFLHWQPAHRIPRVDGFYQLVQASPGTFEPDGIFGLGLAPAFSVRIGN